MTEFWFHSTVHQITAFKIQVPYSTLQDSCPDFIPFQFSHQTGSKLLLLLHRKYAKDSLERHFALIHYNQNRSWKNCTRLAFQNGHANRYSHLWYISSCGSSFLPQITYLNLKYADFCTRKTSLYTMVISTIIQEVQIPITPLRYSTSPSDLLKVNIFKNWPRHALIVPELQSSSNSSLIFILDKWQCVISLKCME